MLFDLLLVIYWSFTYLTNLSAYSFGGDSSEIATSMSTWGIPHPPGYPLQNLLGNVFIKIFPFFNVYQRASLFSAIFVLLTSIIITRILAQFIKKKHLIFISLLYFFTLFPIWLYSIVPEVFTLSIFIISCQIYFLLKFRKTSNYQYFYLFLFFIGLGICQHHVFVLFIPSYLYILFKVIKIKLNLKIFLKSFVFILLGTLPYIYAPIVSYLNSPLDMENAKTLDGFIRLILRSSYGTFTAYSGATPNIANQLVNVLTIIIFTIKDIKPLGLIIIVFGFMYLFKKIKFLFTFFLVNCALLIYFYFITNFNLSGTFSMATFERFLIFLYLVLVFVFTFGIVYIYDIITSNIEKLTNKNLIKKLFIGSFYFLILVLIFNNLIINYSIIKSLKTKKVFQKYSYDILDSLPEKSYLFLNSDNSIFLVQAAQLIEKKRLDVVRIPSLIGRDYVKDKFLKKHPNISIPSGQELSKIAEMNYIKKIYFYSDKPISNGIWAPNGMTWRYFPNMEEYKKYQQKIIDLNIRYWTKSYSLDQLSKNEKSIFFLNNIYEVYANQLLYATDFLLTLGKRSEVKKILQRFNLSLGDQYSYQISYLSFYTGEKTCSKQTEAIFNSLTNRSIARLSDYKTLISYAKLCRKNEVEIIRKFEKEIVNQTSTNLQNKVTEKTN